MTVDARSLRVNILGLLVAGTTISEAVSIFDGWIARGAREHVTVTSAHGVVEFNGGTRADLLTRPMIDVCRS